MAEYTNRSNTGSTVRNDGGYSSGQDSGPVKKGMYVYAKAGERVLYYSSFDGVSAYNVGPSGGKGGQSEAPHRNGLEFVGVATGKINGTALYQFIEVNWVNSWWQSGGLFNWKGERKSESRTEWVKTEQVVLIEQYYGETVQGTTEEIKAGVSPTVAAGGGTTTTTPITTTGSTGIDTTTLGFIAIIAALIFTSKKKGRK